MKKIRFTEEPIVTILREADRCPVGDGFHSLIWIEGDSNYSASSGIILYSRKAVRRFESILNGFVDSCYKFSFRLGRRKVLSHIIPKERVDFILSHNSS